MKSVATVLSLAASVLTLGCVATDVNLLTPDNRPLPAVPISDVRVFFSAKEVPGPFQRVAFISTHGDAGLTNTGQMIEAARNKAAALGANGILVGSIKEPSSGEALGAKFVSPLLSGDRRGSVLAIRYRAAVIAPMKPGFRDLRWLDPPTVEMKPMSAQWHGAYSDLESFNRPGDELSVESVSILDIVYGFHAGRLAAVKFAVDISRQEAMLKALSRVWGESSGPTTTHDGIETWRWNGASSLGILARDGSKGRAGVVIFDRGYFDLIAEKKSGL